MVKIRWEYKWTKKRIINWVILIVWVIALTVAILIPPDFYGQHISSTGVVKNARTYYVQIAVADVHRLWE